MNTKEKIKKELDDLLKDAKNLISYLKGKVKKIEIFYEEYQHWYTRALKAVEFFAPDRLNEFKNYYEINPKRKTVNDQTYTIQDFINDIDPNPPDPSKKDLSFLEASYSVPIETFNCKHRTSKNFFTQYTILKSISARIDSALSQAEATLFAELQDAELETAEKLLKISPRAAGVIAGVILEAFLQKIAKNHNIPIKKNPTISNLNDPLKQAGVYDTTNWRKISFLADIRNLCGHKKEDEPTVEKVKELIEGVNWAIKNIS